MRRFISKLNRLRSTHTNGCPHPTFSTRKVLHQSWWQAGKQILVFLKGYIILWLLYSRNYNTGTGVFCFTVVLKYKVVRFSFFVGGFSELCFKRSADRIRGGKWRDLGGDDGGAAGRGQRSWAYWSRGLLRWDCHRGWLTSRATVVGRWRQHWNTRLQKSQQSQKKKNQFEFHVRVGSNEFSYLEMSSWPSERRPDWTWIRRRGRTSWTSPIGIYRPDRWASAELPPPALGNQTCRRSVCRALCSWCSCRNNNCKRKQSNLFYFCRSTVHT